MFDNFSDDLIDFCVDLNFPGYLAAEDAAQSYQEVPHFVGSNFPVFAGFSNMLSKFTGVLRINLLFIQFQLYFIVLDCDSARAP